MHRKQYPHTNDPVSLREMSPRTRSFFIIGALTLALGIVLWIIQPKPTSAPENSKPGAQLPVGLQWGRFTKTTDCRISGPLPDSSCTPGDIIPENTKEVLCDPSFRTSAIRDSSTSPAEKRGVYERYGIPHPVNNRGSNQVCEIDHLVPLELGGADTMANLWPQCTAGYSNWEGAGFRDKDRFENYLRRQVCSGALELSEAQVQMAADWFKYWVAAGRPHD